MYQEHASKTAYVAFNHLEDPVHPVPRANALINGGAYLSYGDNGSRDRTNGNGYKAKQTSQERPKHAWEYRKEQADKTYDDAKAKPPTELAKNIITFLGFKCVSGKFMYIGIPEGESFLFGEFGKKFYNLRIEMKREEGITFFEPGFIENKRTNYYLKNDIYNNEENIFEEEYLMNLEGDKLNQSITTTMIDENIFRSQKVDEKIPGYDYKEVINQTNRNWIKNKYIKNKNKKNMTKIKTLNDAKTLYLSIKEKSVSKSTYIFQEQDEKEVYLYNPLPEATPILK